VGYYDYDFTIGVRLVLMRETATLGAAQAARKAWNQTGAIRAEMQAQVGGANALADAEVSSSGLYLDEEGVHKDQIVTELLITARG
jgi:hypothetical protein